MQEQLDSRERIYAVEVSGQHMTQRVAVSYACSDCSMTCCHPHTLAQDWSLQLRHCSTLHEDIAAHQCVRARHGACPAFRKT